MPRRLHLDVQDWKVWPARLCVAAGLRWSVISKFMKTRVSQTAAAIPLIGYALLWSEKAKEYFELQNVLGGGLWFTPTARLLLLYFGAISLTAAWGIYGVWCPPLIKRITNVSDYLLSEQQASSILQFNNIKKQVEGLRNVVSEQPRQVEWHLDRVPLILSKEIPIRPVDRSLNQLQHETKPEWKGVVLHAWFLYNEGVYLYAQIAAAAFASVGVVLVVMPSIEVFFAVIKMIILPSLGWR